MDIEEVVSRLSALENERADEKRKKLEDSFMEKYGSKFKNDRGLGMAILEEINRRGIDTSAADEAVQGVLDELRSDIQKLSELINDAQEAVATQEEKLDSIDEAVANSVAKNPDRTKDATPDDVPLINESTPSMTSDVAPPAPDMSQPPAPNMSQPSAPDTPQPAPDMPQPAPEQPLVTSDQRLKHITKLMGDIKARRNGTATQKNSWRPSSAILEGLKV